jgi:hypothetical protein
MKGIVLALVLHTQLCSQCLTDEPCSEAIRLRDKWLEHIAKTSPSIEHAAQNHDVMEAA